MKKIFGEYNLTYKKLIVFAVFSGIYTAAMTLIPFVKDTSFSDITISFEVWILFGVFIIMNSKSARESAIKCFFFFLISQPLVYLLQVSFVSDGFGIFRFYKNWIVWTILTLPMGYFGYYMKANKWWGLVILFPILVFLGVHYYNFLRETIFMFPNHLLSTLFCFITLLGYPYLIFDNKKLKLYGTVISGVIIMIMSIFGICNRIIYITDILVNGGEPDLVFDNTYSVYLEDDKYGEVYIRYDEGLEDYLISGEFNRGGKTNLILEDSFGNKTSFVLKIDYNSFDIEKK